MQNQKEPLHTPRTIAGIESPLQSLRDLDQSADASIAVTADIVSQGEITGISGQFLADAATYDDRYYDAQSMAAHVGRPFERISFKGDSVQTILDIGCGSGNATIALCNRFPHARIVASDLSPTLLAILRRRAIECGVSDRIDLVVADASTLRLHSQVFDVIVGSSMLHHLVDPGAAVTKFLQALTPNGIACFFEPFAPGYYVIRNALRTLAAINSLRGGLEDDVMELIDRCVFGVDFVLTASRSDPTWYSLDDKWLFTASQFHDWGAASKCSTLIYSTNPEQATIADKIHALFASALGKKVVLPDWANDYLADLERARTSSLKNDLLMEGGIIYRKLPQATSAER